MVRQYPEALDLCKECFERFADWLQSGNPNLANHAASAGALADTAVASGHELKEGLGSLEQLPQVGSLPGLASWSRSRVVNPLMADPVCAWMYKKAILNQTGKCCGIIVNVARSFRERFVGHPSVIVDNR